MKVSEAYTPAETYTAMAEKRRDYNRTARSPEFRAKLFAVRVALAKRARAILADAKWAKRRAAAEDGILAAQKEFAKANEPFERLKKAQQGLYNAEAVRDAVERDLAATLKPLQSESEKHEDFLWSDLVGLLQSALDSAMNSRGSNAEASRTVLKAALKTATQLPYKFTGGWTRWEFLLARLRHLADTRGTQMDKLEKWDSDDIYEADDDAAD